MKRFIRDIQVYGATLVVLMIALGNGVESYAVPVTPRAVGLADNALPLSLFVS